MRRTVDGQAWQADVSAFQRAAQRPVARNVLFAGLVLLGFLNGITERIIVAVTENGVSAALANTFDVSVIVWCACAIGITFLLREISRSANRWDWIVAFGCVVAFVLPIVPLSWLAMSGLAIYVLRTSPPSSFARRGAAIMFAVTIPMFWGRLLFASLSDLILQGDAALVGWLVGTKQIGNAIQFADGSGYLWIAPACSSLANVSLAILCWVTISEMLNRKGSLWDFAWIAAACTAVVMINVSRISLIGLYRDHFELIHGPVGSTVTSWVILGATVGICLIGVRHDIPARA